MIKSHEILKKQKSVGKILPLLFALAMRASAQEQKKAKNIFFILVLFHISCANERWNSIFSELLNVKQFFKFVYSNY